MTIFTKIRTRLRALLASPPDGYIEQAGPAKDDVRAVTGWGPQGALSGGPLTILSPGGGVLLAETFERGDLDPDEHLGFSGIVIGSAAQAIGPGCALTLLSPTGDKIRLPAAHSFRADASISTPAGLGTPGGDGSALRRVLTGLGPDLEDAGISCQVDNLFLLPGFGLFLRGWVLSGTHRLADLQVTAGDEALRLDRASLVRTARPDLTHTMDPDPLGFLQAGFLAICRGKISRPNAPISVTFGFHDGAQIETQVPTSTVELLDTPAAFERLARLFPLLPDLDAAGAIWRAAQDVLPRPKLRDVLRDGAVGPANLVVVLPANAENAAWLLDDVAQSFEALPKGTGITLVTESAALDPRLHATAADLNRAFGAKPRLLSVDGPVVSLLPDLLPETATGPVVFLEASVRPTSAGWTEIAAIAEGARPLDRPTVFAAAHGLAGFAWTVEAYRDWMAGQAEPVVGSTLDLLAETTGAGLASGLLQTVSPLPAQAFLSALERAARDQQ